jgi:hypothetical protein
LKNGADSTTASKPGATLAAAETPAAGAEATDVFDGGTLATLSTLAGLVNDRCNFAKPV